MRKMNIRIGNYVNGEYVPMRKADDTGDDEPTDKKLSEQLDEIVAEMIAATGGDLHPDRARRWLLHTPQGQQLLLSQRAAKKKETPMPVDVFKLSNIESVREISKHITEKDDITEFDFTKILMGHARLNKRDNESDGAAFERILTAPENTELRQAYQVTKGMASMTPTIAVVGDTRLADDSAEAVRLLTEMAEQTGTSFEVVFAAPENRELAARTYRVEQRPNASSTSGSELQR